MENPKYVETKEVFGNDFFYLKSSLMRTFTLSPAVLGSYQGGGSGGWSCGWVECGGGGRGGD